MESDFVKVALGLAWPIVALVYATLTFFVVLLFLSGQFGTIPPAPLTAPVPTGSPSLVTGDPRIVWWATFVALTAAILALVATKSPLPNSLAATTAGFLLLSLLGSLVKFFQYTHQDYHNLAKWAWLFSKPLQTPLGVLSVAAFGGGILFMMIAWWRR